MNLYIISPLNWSVIIRIYVLDYDCNAYLLIRFKMRRNTIIHIKQNRKSYQIERNERV